jgi:uncharacterized OB-fold protein
MNEKSSGQTEEPAASVAFQDGLFEEPATPDGAPALLAGRCRQCGRTLYPRRAECPGCTDGGDVEDVTIGGSGVVYTSTVVRVPSPVGLKPPYAYGYVDLNEVALRVFALFTGADPASFVPGTEVELVVEPLLADAQGRSVVAYKFRPVA